MQGLLLLDKPKNKTSYGAVACIKKLSGEKRVGHTGTLDPMATGVLPVLLGRATALSSYLLDADKRYTARVRLGLETDTCDITGSVLQQAPVQVTAAELSETLKGFLGPQLQQPPMFSALKRDGVRLYELARQGRQVDIPLRKIEVYSLDLLSPPDETNEFEIDVSVSKGTYIRSLARDIGRALGCGAVLTGLRRTFASGFDIARCVPLDILDREHISEYLLPAETAVAALPAVEVTERQAVRFCNGGQLSLDRLHIGPPEPGARCRVRCCGRFLGIGEIDREAGELAVKCVIWEEMG